MPAPRSFDEKRARIADLASAPAAIAAAELERFLGEKSGFLVGEAAQMAERLELRALVPALAAAFARLLIDPVKVDKTCAGKNRLVETLLAFDAQEPEVYLAGIKHRQPEPAFGAPIDTAAGLRGLCAHALFHIAHRDALVEVAPLLADTEPITRLEAASALGGSGMRDVAALLHLKALGGDREPDVLGACYKGLLRLEAPRYLSFVDAALQGDEDAIAEAAALALGESRLPEALGLLRRALSTSGGRRSDGLLLAIALSRSDEATAFLLSLVDEAPERRAEGALRALALQRHDARLVERIRALVDARRSRTLAAAFNQHFSLTKGAGA